MTDAEHERREAAKRRLRAALDGVELLPELTADDRVIRASEQDKNERDSEFVRNKPPHHG